MSGVRYLFIPAVCNESFYNNILLFAEVSYSHDFKGLYFSNVSSFFGYHRIDDGTFSGRSM